MVITQHIRFLKTATAAVLLAALACPVFAPAQLVAPDGIIEQVPPYIIKTWRVADGLPYNQINDILQRRNGYIWLATPNGAARFDGMDFEHFSMREIGDLPNDLITGLFEDQAGNLFLGHGTGHISVRTGSRFTVLECPTQWAGTSVTGFSERNDGSVWAANSRDEQLQLTDADGIIAHPQHIEPSKRPAEGWTVRDERIVRLKDGEVVEDRGPTPWAIEQQTIRFLERRNGDLVAGTEHGGVFILHKDGGITRIRLLEGLASNTILCLSEDAEESLWIGTPVGLQSIRFQCPSFSGIHANWPFIVFRSVAPRRKGGIWLGSNKGLIYRLENGELTQEQGFDYMERVFRTLIEDHNETLWSNDDFGFLLKHHEESGNTARIWPESRAIDRIRILHETADGTLWAGGEIGIWNRSGESWQNIYGPERGISDILCFASTEDNALWIGMKHGGLVRLHNNHRNFIELGYSLANEDVSALLVDRTAPDRLWIGTAGKGLYRLEDGKVEEVRIQQNIISGMLQDPSGRLWVMGELGLSAFRPDALQDDNTPKSIIHLDINDGIGSGMDIREASSALCETADHTFWVLSDQQVVSFNPLEIQAQTQPVPLLLTDAIVNGEQHPIEGLTKITLEPGVNRLDIRFAGLNFVAASRIRFKCRMTGLSREWIELGSRRQASYQHIPPGHYRFELTASNRDGLWNRNPTFIDITVRPFFWESWWFEGGIYLGAGAILVLISLAVADRINRRKLILMEKSKAVELERTRIAMDLHDEIGSELTRLQLLCHRMDVFTKKLGIEETPQSVVEIRKVTNKLVFALDEMVWVVRPANDNLEHLTGYLTQYAASFFENTAITCKTDMPLQLPDAEISGPDRHNLFLALKEAMNNIVKHADASEVLFEVALSGHQFRMAVHDNGKGMASDKDPRFQRGLRSMERRMKLNGGTFSIRTNENGGTTVEFTQPIKEEKQ